jgi:hypothetical protein
MINVKWELDGSAVDETSARTAVQRIQNYTQQALAGIECPVHHEPPWLVIQGSTLKNLTVSIGSCCADLKARAEERIRRVSRREGE